MKKYSVSLPCISAVETLLFSIIKLSLRLQKQRSLIHKKLSEMNTEVKLIKTKLELLNLSEQFGSLLRL